MQSEPNMNTRRPDSQCDSELPVSHDFRKKEFNNSQPQMTNQGYTYHEEINLYDQENSEITPRKSVFDNQTRKSSQFTNLHKKFKNQISVSGSDISCSKRGSIFSKEAPRPAIGSRRYSDRNWLIDKSKFSGQSIISLKNDTVCQSEFTEENKASMFALYGPFESGHHENMGPNGEANLYFGESENKEINEGHVRGVTQSEIVINDGAVLGRGSSRSEIVVKSNRDVTPSNNPNLENSEFSISLPSELDSDSTPLKHVNHNLSDLKNQKDIKGFENNDFSDQENLGHEDPISSSKKFGMCQRVGDLEEFKGITRDSQQPVERSIDKMSDSQKMSVLKQGLTELTGSKEGLRIVSNYEESDRDILKISDSQEALVKTNFGENELSEFGDIDIEENQANIETENVKDLKMSLQNYDSESDHINYVDRQETPIQNTQIVFETKTIIEDSPQDSKNNEFFSESSESEISEKIENDKKAETENPEKIVLISNLESMVESDKRKSSHENPNNEGLKNFTLAEMDEIILKPEIEKEEDGLNKIRQSPVQPEKENPADQVESKINPVKLKKSSPKQKEIKNLKFIREAKHQRNRATTESELSPFEYDTEENHTKNTGTEEYGERNFEDYRKLSEVYQNREDSSSLNSGSKLGLVALNAKHLRSSENKRTSAPARKNETNQHNYLANKRIVMIDKNKRISSPEFGMKLSNQKNQNKESFDRIKQEEVIFENQICREKEKVLESEKIDESMNPPQDAHEHVDYLDLEGKMKELEGIKTVISQMNRNVSETVNFTDIDSEFAKDQSLVRCRVILLTDRGSDPGRFKESEINQMEAKKQDSDVGRSHQIYRKKEKYTKRSKKKGGNDARDRNSSWEGQHRKPMLGTDVWTKDLSRTMRAKTDIGTQSKFKKKEVTTKVEDQGAREATPEIQETGEELEIKSQAKATQQIMSINCPQPETRGRLQANNKEPQAVDSEILESNMQASKVNFQKKTFHTIDNQTLEMMTLNSSKQPNTDLILSKPSEVRQISKISMQSPRSRPLIKSSHLSKAHTKTLKPMVTSQYIPKSHISQRDMEKRDLPISQVIIDTESRRKKTPTKNPSTVTSHSKTEKSDLCVSNDISKNPGSTRQKNSVNLFPKNRVTRKFSSPVNLQRRSCEHRGESWMRASREIYQDFATVDKLYKKSIKYNSPYIKSRSRSPSANNEPQGVHPKLKNSALPASRPSPLWNPKSRDFSPNARGKVHSSLYVESQKQIKSQKVTESLDFSRKINSKIQNLKNEIRKTANQNKKKVLTGSQFLTRKENGMRRIEDKQVIHESAEEISQIKKPLDRADTSRPQRRQAVEQIEEMTPTLRSRDSAKTRKNYPNQSIKVHLPSEKIEIPRPVIRSRSPIPSPEPMSLPQNQITKIIRRDEHIPHKKSPLESKKSIPEPISQPHPRTQLKSFNQLKTETMYSKHQHQIQTTKSKVKLVDQNQMPIKKNKLRKEVVRKRHQRKTPTTSGKGRHNVSPAKRFLDEEGNLVIEEERFGLIIRRKSKSIEPRRDLTPKKIANGLKTSRFEEHKRSGLNLRESHIQNSGMIAGTSKVAQKGSLEYSSRQIDLKMSKIKESIINSTRNINNTPQRHLARPANAPAGRFVSPQPIRRTENTARGLNKNQRTIFETTMETQFEGSPDTYKDSKYEGSKAIFINTQFGNLTMGLPMTPSKPGHHKDTFVSQKQIPSKESGFTNHDSQLDPMNFENKMPVLKVQSKQLIQNSHLSTANNRFKSPDLRPQIISKKSQISNISHNSQTISQTLFSKKLLSSRENQQNPESGIDFQHLPIRKSKKTKRFPKRQTTPVVGYTQTSRVTDFPQPKSGLKPDEVAHETNNAITKDCLEELSSMNSPVVSPNVQRKPSKVQQVFQVSNKGSRGRQRQGYSKFLSKVQSQPTIIRPKEHASQHQTSSGVHISHKVITTRSINLNEVSEKSTTTVPQNRESRWESNFKKYEKRANRKGSRVKRVVHSPTGKRTMEVYRLPPSKSPERQHNSSPSFVLSKMSQITTQSINIPPQSQSIKTTNDYGFQGQTPEFKGPTLNQKIHKNVEMIKSQIVASSHRRPLKISRSTKIALKKETKNKIPKLQFSKQNFSRKRSQHHLGNEIRSPSPSGYPQPGYDYRAVSPRILSKRIKPNFSQKLIKTSSNIKMSAPQTDSVSRVSQKHFNFEQDKKRTSQKPQILEQQSERVMAPASRFSRIEKPQILDFSSYKDVLNKSREMALRKQRLFQQNTQKPSSQRRVVEVGEEHEQHPPRPGQEGFNVGWYTTPSFDNACFDSRKSRYLSKRNSKQ